MKKFLLLLLLAVSYCGQSQNPSDRDPDYNNNYNLPLNYYFINGDASLFRIQNDNKIIFALDNKKLIRVEDNLQDTSFGATFSGGVVQDFCILPNGKIVAVGSFTHCNGQLNHSIVRLNSDGTVDPTFSSGTNAMEQFLEVKPTIDGKVLVKSYLNSFYNGVAWNKKLFRLNANGTLDQTFNYNSTALPKIFEPQPDGKVIVIDDGDYFTRYLSNGQIDPSFSSIGIGNMNVINSIVLEADGKIVIAGLFDSFDGLPLTSVIRLSSNGVIDPSFTTINANHLVNTIIRQTSGKYVISGKFTTINGVTSNHIARLNSNGSHDTTGFLGFEDSNTQLTPVMVQQPNGKILFSGIAADERLKYDNNIITNIFRTSVDGSIDTTMENKTKGFYPFGPLAVAQNINGKIICITTQLFTTTFNGQDIGAIKQFNTDWTVDEEFEQTIVANFEPADQYSAVSFTHVRVLDDGRIILAGNFKYTYQGTVRYDLVVLNPDGSIIYGFNSNFGWVEDLDVDPVTGKIIIMTGSGMTRLLPSGLPDSFSFNPQGVTEKYEILYLPNGKIAFTGGYNKRLYMLNSNGSYDNSFPTNLWCEQLQLAADGTILFVQAGSGILKKLTANGILDTAFNSNVAVQNTTTYNVQPDGKILNISTTDAINADISRVHPNGSLDTSFESKHFDKYFVNYLTTLRYGKIFASGSFTKFNYVPENGAVVLLGEDYYYLIGQNKFDNDSNGCSDTDIDYPFMKYEVANGNQINYHVANYTGSYSIAMTEGNYVVTPKIENPSYFTITPASVSLNFPTATSPQQQNFCIAPNGIHQDLEIVVLPLTIARPGFEAQYKIVYKNKGNVMVSGQVALNFLNNVMTFDSATPAATTTANQLTWNYVDLWPFESREIVVSFTLNTPTGNPPLNGGDILNLTAAVTPETSDEMPSDNSFVLNQTVVNSFDPNDKTCLEGDTISQEYVGKYVHYMIRFENTGNGEAVNVTVKDNIDPSKFDIASIVPLSGSHPFVTKIKDNSVSFLFENINLPFADATNDGYVMFKIKLIDTLEGGDIFTNQAEIYFDYNYPITTNTASTTIQNTMAVEDIKVTSIVIYPNPANDFISILHSEQIIKVEIYSVDGRLVKSVLNPVENKLDISSLTKGQYFIKVDDGSGKHSAKLIKN